MNMNKVIMFVLGATAGSLVTWKLVEKKYKKIADEEITSVIEHYHNKLNALDLDDHAEKDRPQPQEDEEDVTRLLIDGVEVARKANGEFTFTEEEQVDYKNAVASLGYSEEGITVECDNPIEYVKPYVIAPEEFGESGNDTKTLTYYSDFVLADEDGDMFSDPEMIIGDALEHFGDYEDDSVHVRNDNIECDFEILKSEKTFSEVYKEDN